MADAFSGDRTGGAVAQTSALTADISVRQGRVWVNRLQKMYGSGWWVILRAKSAIVDPRDAAVPARGWCSISLLKQNKDSVTTEIPAACNLWNRTLFFRARDSERCISKVPDHSDECFPWSGETSTVYWCIASKSKAPWNFYWMSNMFLWVEIFLFFVCYHVVPKRHSQLDYELNGL